VGGILPFLFFLILIGVAVWAIVRFTSANRARPFQVAVPAPLRRDPALEELRLKYARGDMDRAEFVERSRDLGAMVPESGEPPSPETG
jgi:putative membrane protein